MKSFNLDSKTTSDLPNQFHVLRTRQDLIYVDQSLLIKELIDTGVRAFSFTIPRGFAKSVNLSMLHCFLSPVVDGIQTADLFKDLNIAKDAKFMKEYQGKGKVVYLDFAKFSMSSFSKFCDSYFNYLIELSTHLINECSLDEVKNRAFKELLNKLREKKEDEYYLEEYLDEIIKVYANRRYCVTVLIDNVDKPFLSAVQHGFYSEVESFLRSIFINFKGNDNICKIVTTQTYPMLMGNTYHYSSHPFYNSSEFTYFCYSESVVSQLFKNEKISLSKLQELYSYKFKDKIIYSPRDVHRHLNHQAVNLQPHGEIAQLFKLNPELAKIDFSQYEFKKWGAHLDTNFYTHNQSVNYIDRPKFLKMLYCTGDVIAKRIVEKSNPALSINEQCNTFKFEFSNQNAKARYEKTILLYLLSTLVGDSHYKTDILYSLFSGMKIKYFIDKIVASNIGVYIAKQDVFSILKTCKATLFQSEKLIAKQWLKQSIRLIKCRVD